MGGRLLLEWVAGLIGMRSILAKAVTSGGIGGHEWRFRLTPNRYGRRAYVGFF
jgi:hypothetical protein